MESCTIQSGVIDQVNNDFVRIKIIQPSACSACHAKGGCMVFNSKENHIDVSVRDREFQPGEAVSLRIKDSQGLKAVLLGYVIPFIMIIVALLALTSVVNEGVAGLFALLSVVIYYGVLRLFGKNLTRKFTYEIIRM